ncbi:MAG TPA: acetolactate decarboxylase [Syntrophorhabdaceae bacterium]|jgi:acetolactate decarboxylase
MRRFIVYVLVLVFTATGLSYAGQDTLTQISTIDALMTGIYDGETTLGALKGKGDFGVGTYNSLDGEMVLVDGEFYRINGRGAVERPGMETKTPFAAVTYFEADRTVILDKDMDFAGVANVADRMLPTLNMFYAIKISGVFRIVKTRSVPAQEKPYKPLKEVVKTQPLFTLKNVKGTIVGFRCPPYVKGVNVPGYHLHFITADRSAGGHVLDFAVEKATLEIDDTTEFTLIIPSDRDFYQADLTPDREKDLKAVEK